MATKFRDNLDHEWLLSLSIGKARMIRDQLGVDILNPESLLALTGNTLDQVAMAAILCRDQATELGVTVEEFEERLVGEGFLDAAAEAVLAECQNFCQTRGKHAHAKVLATAIERMRVGQERLEEMVQTGALDSMLEGVKKEMDRKYHEAVGKQSQS